MTLTDEQIEEIKARAEAATPGPWAYESVSEKSNDYAVGIICPVDDEGDPAAPISGNVKNHPHYLNTATGDFGEWWREQVCAIDEGWHGNYGNPHDDAAFIAHARTDIPLLLAALEAEKKRADEAEDRAERFQDALQELQQWANAYPLNIFPEPNFSLAAKVLTDAGISLDAISASNMRHVLSRVEEITRVALKENSHDKG